MRQRKSQKSGVGGIIAHRFKDMVMLIANQSKYITQRKKMTTTHPRSLRAIKFALTIFGSVFSSAQGTESLAYFCEIKSVAFADDDGSMREIKRGENHMFTHYIGSKFKVIKATGEIDGGIVSNKKEGVRSTTILDTGGRGQSYKIISIFGPNTSILYIQIDDYGKVEKSGRYTFSGFRLGEFITGICI